MLFLTQDLCLVRPPTCTITQTTPPLLICSTIRIRKQKRGNGGLLYSARQIRAQQDDPSPSQFLRRIEQAWSISKQPRPVPCSSCDANGYVECKWCRGTGFFILGDNMLCEVPSRNTTCVICAGQGSVSCSDCKGTGYKAKWLAQPPMETAESEPT
ncbi:hypothetical protein SUGI_1171820 [Cryptomeria japonica]|nr:hypothetical protein SUGI_1171820 [Cryptomeria japonica]